LVDNSKRPEDRFDRENDDLTKSWVAEFEVVGGGVLGFYAGANRFKRSFQ